MAIVIIDSGISNIASVVRAFGLVGAVTIDTATPLNIPTASAIVLPGVGAFAEGMENIRARGLEEPILSAARDKIPILGICLGMQLLAQSSDEHGRHEGFGLLKGHVRKLPETLKERVPNVGWCDVSPSRRGVLFPEMSLGCYYHVHSFHFVPEDPNCVAATTCFGDVDIVVAVEQENVFGVQFHPEKSQDEGLKLIAAFVDHLRRTRRLH